MDSNRNPDQTYWIIQDVLGPAWRQFDVDELRSLVLNHLWTDGAITEDHLRRAVYEAHATLLRSYSPTTDPTPA